jgi:disulfide oxidoreductase YuzD
MANKDTVSIRIVNLPGSGRGCACGNIAASPQFAAVMNQIVKELRGILEVSYPGQTKVEYVDLRESPADLESELGQLLVSKKYPPPLVVINGEPKFAGSVNTNKIVKEVRKILSS